MLQPKHVGLGKEDLSAARVDTRAGADRGRVKPYRALVEEYARVLGKTPDLAMSQATATTFAVPAARWYEEPTASAVSLYTAYRIAFEGCLAKTSGPSYSEMPTEGRAREECSNWARTFWSRTPSDDETSACVTVATKSSVEEVTTDQTTPTTSERRWAYACAAVLSATGFLTY